MTGIKIIGATALLSGTGTVLAQTPMIPKNFEAWPLTAILGFITILAISAMMFMVKKVFEAQDKQLLAQAEHDKVLMALAVELSKNTAASNEMNKRLNQRKCLAKNEG